VAYFATVGVGTIPRRDERALSLLIEPTDLESRVSIRNCFNWFGTWRRSYKGLFFDGGGEEIAIFNKMLKRISFLLSVELGMKRFQTLWKYQNSYEGLIVVYADEIG